MSESNIKVLDSQELFNGKSVSSVNYFNQSIQLQYTEDKTKLSFKAVIKWKEYIKENDSDILKELIELEFRHVNSLEGKIKFNEEFQKKVLNDVVDYLYNNVRFDFSNDFSFKYLK